MNYDHLAIEPKWQKRWEEEGVFEAKDQDTRPKYYALCMFPYPSAAGLHVGHPESYTATDIMARYKRTKGFNVLCPMGWDAFGLPAEQFAIKTGLHPAIVTEQSINNFRRQLKAFGISFDWDREVSTCDPSYYKWTQFIFLKLYEKGLAYQKEVPVNWCPELRTVLANEEVIDGKSERGGHPVFRVPMKQWMLKITEYAESLLADIDELDWPERTREGQKNWIGKSEGAEIDFNIEGFDKSLRVFTTRPDTLFGATFMVLAPEHPFVSIITSNEQKKAVDKYVDTSSRKSEIDRQASKEKTGVFTGAFAINPANKEKIPIWIADYVLMGYGTGAIMAVPGHDERDFEFATEFEIEIKRVIDSKEELPYPGEGPHVNSDFIDGLGKNDAIKAMIDYLVKNKLGEKKIQYKLRDWLFSRQRFWGEPFPIIHFDNGKSKAVPVSELPVVLPEVAEYQPSEKGESPLARNQEWVKYKDSKTGDEGRRETDTMPGSAGSSWYFLRYIDPHNKNAPFDFEKQKYWMPVDLYIGGAEHTVGHLLYSRFWQKVLYDAGLVSHKEPFKKLVHQGMILGEDGEKMSKSRGNVINPDVLVEKFGADSVRAYLMFMGPLDKDKPWSTNGIEGVRRFLDRVWRLIDENVNENSPAANTTKTLHKTIKKVTEDIESLNFNTAISQMMILVNDLYKSGERPKSLLLTLSQLLMPFAPHLSEEIWEKLGGNGLVSVAPWPSYDSKLIVDDQITLAVQVLGKTRGKVEIAPDASEEEAMALALEVTSVKNAIGDKSVVKVIYKAGKILNIIAN